MLVRHSPTIEVVMHNIWPMTRLEIAMFLAGVTLWAVAGAIWAVGNGLLAPTFTRLLLLAPKSLVTSLAGLAMLRVLQAAFVTAFKERFSLGALVALLVTAADISLLNVGAAFWGLVAGVGMSWLLELADFVADHNHKDESRGRAGDL